MACWRSCLRWVFTHGYGFGLVKVGKVMHFTGVFAFRVLVKLWVRSLVLSFIFPADINSVSLSRRSVQHSLLFNIFRVCSTGNPLSAVIFPNLVLLLQDNLNKKIFLRGLRSSVLRIYTPENSICKPSWKSVSFNLMFSTLAV